MNDTTSLDDIIGNLTDLGRDLKELADAFGRTGNNHVADLSGNTFERTVKTLSLKDFKGNKDAYYNFKRSYQESVKKMREASIHAGFFTPSEVYDVQSHEGMNLKFED